MKLFRMYYPYYAPIVLCMIYMFFLVLGFCWVMYILYNPETISLKLIYGFTILRAYKMLLNAYLPYRDRLVHLGKLLA